ncbi:SPW repeat protein [Cesiribacter sp. SM1]|uniref:SPW repeat protein n=1 Tax=Cesiribacter sp. SM1 TaxID=2861196 RepID=UPI001CD7ECA3|nr:SPW repeat protein [Cesiribacter sp. SM1]
MRFIPTRIHGMVDYLMGLLLIASPWIFNFNRGGAETWIPVILGAGLILISLFTDYELSVSRKISMPTHLWMDVLAGAFLAVSPWLFDFDEYVYLPHLILGIAEIGAGLFTKKVPDTHPHHTANNADARTTTGTATTSRTNATIVDNSTNRPVDRPAMGSNADTRVPSERDRADRERIDRDRDRLR